jgi:hypothetical protein
MQITSSAAYVDSKPHYDLLDGLRGVAALLVLWYHVFEGYQFAGNKPIIENINHGYLAVDFFFILSGFVISYAYDDRMRNTMTMKNFFKRRLIRLHPMVIMGALIGTVTFFLQGAVQWDGTHVATSAVMIALLCAMFFVPALPGSVYEVRGNGEMFPLNGPAWSLFFEYIGNILYALFIHRISNKALSVLVICLGLLLGAFALTDYSGYGYSGYWMDTRRSEFHGRHAPHVVPLHPGHAGAPPLQADADPWRLLDLHGGTAADVFRAVHSGAHADMLQWSFRDVLHRRRLPRLGMDGRVGQHHRPNIVGHLQVSGRHIIPCLHRPLPTLLSFLRLAHQEPLLYVRRNMAGGALSDYHQRGAGLRLSEVL